jgi:putative membrane protein
MLKPFANSARALATGPLTWRTWTGLIAVPLIVMGLLTWAFWKPDSNHGTATAAVVNNDEPVQVSGKTIPLGRQLAGDLTHSDDSAYKWVLTDSDDASAGLVDGTYSAVVNIPNDFSARATSPATGKPLDARKAEVNVTTSDAAGVTDPRLTDNVAQATQRTLNQQVVQTYLDNVYVGLTTIHGQVNQAADGAGQLADGTGQLAPGAKKLDDGSSQLAKAAGELSAGADKLADGTAQLAAGSTKLADGLSQAQRDTAQLPALTRQLADGANQVAGGNEQLASTVVPLANRAIAAIDALPSAQDAAAGFQGLADRCASGGGAAQFCQDLSATAARFNADSQKIDSVKTTVRASIVTTRDAVQKLAGGARQVADGNAQLADKSANLASGIATAADGAQQLNGGIQQTNTGARKLADGGGQLAGGSKDLASGAGQLNTGVIKVNDGARELSTQLDQGRDQVPSYTDAEREHLKTVASDPSTATTDTTPVGTLALTLFAALALWAMALATYILTQAVPAAVLTAREPTWRIIVRAALPGAAAAGLAALAITAIAIPVLKLGVVGSVGFLLIALLAASAFVALNQAAAAIFGRAGRLASLAILVLAAATGIVSTLPGPLYSISGYLPTHGAVMALRAAATDGTGLATGVAELAAWLVVGTLIAILVTDRRRYLSPKLVRVHTVPSPSA